MDRMRERLIRSLNRAKDSFMGFTAGQKAVVVVGTAALLVAAVMVFNWASTPSYAPLFSGLSGPDASSIIDELKKEGVAYQISGDGSTIMVPQSEVYSTRIALSGKGLPSSSDTGYSILDKQGLSTSEFQQQTDFKRAMEGELDRTIEAISGVNTAIVHLAIPAQQVFSDQQQPTTASVLVALAPGTTLTPEQVQAIVRLTASSVAGLDPKNVTVTDNTGQVLTGTDGANGLTGASTQAASVAAFASTVKAQVQSMLDTVVGPGNSTITITPVLNFDQSTQQRREYLIPTKPIPPLSESHTLEQYSGTGGASANGVGGVVGSNGQMGSTASSSNGPSAYRSTTATQDNAVGQQDTTTQSAPGAIKSLHIGVVLDATTAAKIQPAVVQQLITAGVGIDPTRGDTIDVTSLPFDRTAQNAAAAELAAAASAKSHAATMAMFRNIGIGAAVAVFLLIAWWQGRRRNKARVEATDYIVEQLRSEQAERMALETMKPVPALEMPVVHREDDRIRDELIALVDKQPEDVAALLRGWLVEPR